MFVKSLTPDSDSGAAHARRDRRVLPCCPTRQASKQKRERARLCSECPRNRVSAFGPFLHNKDSPQVQLSLLGQSRWGISSPASQEPQVREPSRGGGPGRCPASSPRRERERGCVRDQVGRQVRWG